MRKITISCIEIISLVAMLYPNQVVCACDWDLAYTAIELPAVSGWTLRRSLEDTSEIIEAGILRTGITAPPGTEVFHSYSFENTGSNTVGSTIEARIKLGGVDSGLPTDTYIGVYDTSQVDYLAISPEGITLLYSFLTYEMDTTAEFHTYRMTLKGTKVSVYVDGLRVLEGTPILPMVSETGGFVFGHSLDNREGDAPLATEAFWEEVRVSSQGACEVVCGDGTVETGEECDPGDPAPHDCCDDHCEFEEAGIPCDDGNVCTQGDTCDGDTGSCQPGLPVGCNQVGPNPDESAHVDAPVQATTSSGGGGGSGCSIHPVRGSGEALDLSIFVIMLPLVLGFRRARSRA